MLELYYTPEVLAYYINIYNFSEQYKIKLIHRIYHFEKAFIHPKYQNNKKLFIKKILDFSDYLYYKEELDEELESIEKDMNFLGNDFKNKYILSKKPPLNFFFITTRLQLLFNNKKYIRIKLRTLLKNYGYKKKSNKILKHLEKCMYFYHIQAFFNNEEVDIFEVDIDNMITFRLNDYYKSIDKKDNLQKNVKYLIKEIDEKLFTDYSYINKINGIDSVSYTIDEKLLINFILHSTYIKTRIHIQPNKIDICPDIRYYVENNYLIINIHDNSDLINCLKIIEQIIKNS